MDKTTVWLDKVQHTCHQFGQNYIDIIIDQCGMDFSIIPALSGFSPEITWCSLYQGLPEDIYRSEAPLLVRINLTERQQVQWVYELAKEVALTAPLLVIVSPWTFSSLADWLKQCVDAEYEGRGGVFRFWDTRIFPWLFVGVLDEHECAQLQRPAVFWSWVDRDGQPALLAGNGAVINNELCQKITFSDAKFEALMCLTDTIHFLSNHSLPATLFPTQEATFSACFNAMLGATKATLLFDDERDTWVLSQLYNSTNKT